MTRFIYGATFKPTYNDRGDLIIAEDTIIKLYAFKSPKERVKWLKTAHNNETICHTLLTKQEAGRLCNDVEYSDYNKNICDKANARYITKYAINYVTGERIKMYSRSNAPWPYVYAKYGYGVMDDTYGVMQVGNGKDDPLNFYYSKGEEEKTLNLIIKCIEDFRINTHKFRNLVELQKVGKLDENKVSVY